MFLQQKYLIFLMYSIWYSVFSREIHVQMNVHSFNVLLYFIKSCVSCLTHINTQICTHNTKYPHTHTPPHVRTQLSLCLSHAVLAGTISEVSLIVLNYALLCSLLSLCSPPTLLFCLLLGYLLSVLS